MTALSPWSPQVRTLERGVRTGDCPATWELVPPPVYRDRRPEGPSFRRRRHTSSVLDDNATYCAAVKFELLAGLSDEDRRSVLARMTRRSFRKGETLFHEGDPGDSLHLIEKAEWRSARRPP